MPDKPTDQEEEYFARQEFERKKKAEEERHKKLEEEEKSRLKELHYMRCPKCGMQLVEIDYCRIKIDRCTACDGVWLEKEGISDGRTMEADWRMWCAAYRCLSV